MIRNASSKRIRSLCMGAALLLWLTLFHSVYVEWDADHANMSSASRYSAGGELPRSPSLSIPSSRGARSLGDDDDDEQRESITMDQLDSDVRKIIDNHVHAETLKKYLESARALPETAVKHVVPLNAANPPNVKRVEGICSRECWDREFPDALDEYTYTSFLKAVGRFPGFCADYQDAARTDKVCRKSMATLFAHMKHETVSMNYIREWGCEEDGTGPDHCSTSYNENCNKWRKCEDPAFWQDDLWPCGENQYYFGRGAKQLSHSYNYGRFSQTVFSNATHLLDNPALVADTELNLVTAIWFFVTPQPPKPSMVNVIDGSWVPNELAVAAGIGSNFATTTNILNGGIECEDPNGANKDSQRAKRYTTLETTFGVTDDDAYSSKVQCQGMGAFTHDMFPEDLYWGKSGTNNECSLVRADTGYLATEACAYHHCVQRAWQLDVVDKSGNIVPPPKRCDLVKHLDSGKRHGETDPVLAGCMDDTRGET